MLVHGFDYDTRAYTGSYRLDISDLDPRAPGTVLIPGNATTVHPPRCGVRLWPFWIDGEWKVFELKDDDPTLDNYWANL